MRIYLGGEEKDEAAPGLEQKNAGVVSIIVSKRLCSGGVDDIVKKRDVASPSLSAAGAPVYIFGGRGCTFQ